MNACFIDMSVNYMPRNLENMTNQHRQQEAKWNHKHDQMQLDSSGILDESNILTLQEKDYVKDKSKTATGHLLATDYKHRTDVKDDVSAFSSNCEMEMNLWVYAGEMFLSPC